MEDFLTRMNAVIEKEEDVQVKRVLGFFNQCDYTMKRVVLNVTGFTGYANPQNICEHFKDLALMDTLNDAIDNIMDNIPPSQSHLPLLRNY